MGDKGGSRFGRRRPRGPDLAELIDGALVAGIPHYWRIEDEDGAPVVHVYELDEPTATYVPVGIFRGSLNRPVPFEINLDLEKLAPPRRG